MGDNGGRIRGNNNIITFYNVHDDGPSSNCVMEHSSDGKTWTDVSKNVCRNSDDSYGRGCYIQKVFWGNNKFIAFVAYFNEENYSYTELYTAYSSDGKNWTSVKKNIPCGVSDIIFGNNKFVAVADGLCDRGPIPPWVDRKMIPMMAYSSNGITWTTVKNYPFGKSATTKIVYGNGVFVAVSEDGKIAYSK